MQSESELFSLGILGRMRTFDEILRWAEKTWGDGSGRMRDPKDLWDQALYSAMDNPPLDAEGRWTADAFVRLPETATTYGGYQTVCIVRVVMTWPGKEILHILYEA